MKAALVTCLVVLVVLAVLARGARRRQVEAELSVGDQLHVEDPETGQVVAVTITEVGDDGLVTVDRDIFTNAARLEGDTRCLDRLMMETMARGLGAVLAPSVYRRWSGEFATRAKPLSQVAGPRATCVTVNGQGPGEPGEPPQVATQVAEGGGAPPEGSADAGADREGVHEPDTLREPRTLVGPRLDAGTTVEIASEGWPDHVNSAREGPAEIEGRAVVIERIAGALVVRAPGQLWLEVREDKATAKMGRRAVDTLGGFKGWALAWLPALTRWLGVPWVTEDVPGETLEALEVAGWVVVAPDIAAEVVGVVLTLAEGDPERWTGRAPVKPVANPGGDLYSLTIGDKEREDTLSLYAYRKDQHIRRHMRKGAGEALLERWRQAGWDGEEPVMRVEVRPRGETMRLRARGDADGEVEIDLSKLTHCADQTKLARVYAYAVGRPEGKSGHFRLTVPSTTATGKLRPTKKCEVDERWRVVQRAAGETPSETLAMCRERKKAAREDWRRRAREAGVRALAEDVALEGVVDETEARARARQRASEWIDGEGWAEGFGRARAATQDLVDDATKVVDREKCGVGGKVRGPDQLDDLWPPRGPCGFCGGPDARHRIFDVIRDRRAAGESISALADDYRVTEKHIIVALEADEVKGR